MKIELDLSHEQAERLRAEAARHSAAPDQLLEALVGYLLELPAVDLGIFARHALRDTGEAATRTRPKPPDRISWRSRRPRRTELPLWLIGSPRRGNAWWSASETPVRRPWCRWRIFEILERIEDEIDLAAAREALAEVEAEGAVPWEQVKAELGL